jgi:hypothetical protein
VASYLSEFPIQGTPVKSTTYPEYPNFMPAGYANPSQGGNPTIENQWQELGDVTMMRGKQNIKIGAEFDHVKSYYDGIFTSQFLFSNIATADPQNVNATGNSIASELLGIPSAGNRDIGNTAGYMRTRAKDLRSAGETELPP